MGSESYLSKEARANVLSWIKGQEVISLEAVRDYVEAEHGSLYQSKRSYYDLLDAAGMSYHKSEKRNPKRDEQQRQERWEEIKKMEQHVEEIKAGEMVVLLEAECHLLWGDGRGYVWGKRGESD